MAQRRNRNRRNRKSSNAVSVISAIALLVIAVLMVMFVGAYIRNNSLFGSLFGGSAEETVLSTEETSGSDDSDIDIDLSETGFGLLTLAGGDIVYAMDVDEASAYEEDQLIEAFISSGGAESEGAGASETAGRVERYYLANSFLDLNGNLYYFDQEGHACTSDCQEGAFIFNYDDDGILKEINYDEGYDGDEDESGRDDYAGLITTKALWVYVDEKNKLGSYSELMYKKTTESLSHSLGGAAVQYASPYAYSIADGTVFYLAVPAEKSNSVSGESGASVSAGSVTELIEGKLYAMKPGADSRYIAGEHVLGFKVLEDRGGDPLVYYYDGENIVRTDSFEKDEDLILFTEDAEYVVNIDEGDRAYLTLAGGQRVTLQSDDFKAGNFRYALAADGEILKVAEKTTVSTGGYTYSVQCGESFGETKSRVIRKDNNGTEEVISSEFSGITYNLHYDFDSYRIIAEYKGNDGTNGLLSISKDGDVEFLEDSATDSSRVVLYGIQDSKAICKRTENGEDVFYSVRLGATVPLAVAVDPSVIVSNDPGDIETETQAADDYDTVNQGEVPVITGEAPGGSGGQTGTDSGEGVISAGPGSQDGAQVGNGPGGGTSGGVIYETKGETIGPGGN